MTEILRKRGDEHAGGHRGETMWGWWKGGHSHGKGKHQKEPATSTPWSCTSSVRPTLTGRKYVSVVSCPQPVVLCYGSSSNLRHMGMFSSGPRFPPLPCLSQFSHSHHFSDPWRPHRNRGGCFFLIKGKRPPSTSLTILQSGRLRDPESWPGIHTFHPK